jgi:colanic acid/amylovoran biosynthesis glycosyltransferase
LILILFPSSYPYDYADEHTFIQPEIYHLLENFEKVILVPRMSKGKMLPLPPDVEVVNQFANFLKQSSNPRKILEMMFSSRRFPQEIRNHPEILLYPSKILKLILFLERAELTRQWVTNFITMRHLDPDDCIFYSYWLDHIATGLAMTKQEFKLTKVISRAHGFDIFEEYYYPYYWPCRRETLDVLDMLFFASDAGRTYLRNRFPQYSSKFETAHLGIKDPQFAAMPSSDGVFRIVSCSRIVPVKRIDLLLDGIAAAARLRPQQKFEWTHFGGGNGIKVLNRRLAHSFPSNAGARLWGNTLNSEIMKFYKDYPVDVFVNVSSTEGGAPVAIQEAISCGIPIVATSVGGNPEIVSEKNGILLNPNPNPYEIASALLTICDDPQLATRMRAESRQLWQRSYNAEVNFSAFAERLKSIGER